MTKGEVEFVPDPSIFIFFEKGKRGAFSYISNRYSKTNSKYLKSYDPKQKSKHIICLDANSLYDYAISKFVPTSGFKWTDPKDPLAPVTVETKREMLFNYQLNIAD